MTYLQTYTALLETIAIARHGRINDPSVSRDKVWGHLDRVVERSWLDSGESEQVDLILWGIEYMKQQYLNLMDPKMYTEDPIKSFHVPKEDKKCYYDEFMFN